MPTWPSSTKASTDNVDSGSDKPRLARADIKQNIDNTNAIIDSFNITSPAEGQTLVYDSSNARFELNNIQQKAVLTHTSTVSPNDDLGLTIVSDPYDLIDQSSGSSITLKHQCFVELYMSRNSALSGGSAVQILAIEDTQNNLIVDGNGPRGLILSKLLSAGDYILTVSGGAGGTGATIDLHLIITKYST